LKIFPGVSLFLIPNSFFKLSFLLDETMTVLTYLGEIIGFAKNS